MSEFRGVDVAKVIGLGANSLHGEKFVVDYRASHKALFSQYREGKLEWEKFQLLEWCLWMHSAANKAMSVLESLGLDDGTEEEEAWYALLCANEDTPEVVQSLLVTQEVVMDLEAMMEKDVAHFRKHMEWCITEPPAGMGSKAQHVRLSTEAFRVGYEFAAMIEDSDGELFMEALPAIIESLVKGFECGADARADASDNDSVLEAKEVG